jgi:NarL family two-component system response regulator LiaR
MPVAPREPRLPRGRRRRRGTLAGAERPAHVPREPPSPLPTSVKRTVLLHGLVAGALIAVLRLIEYRFLVVEHALELYGGLVAVLFAALGVWLGRRLLGPRTIVVVREPAPVPAPPVVAVVPAPEPPGAAAPDPARLARLGVTRREHEILALMAAGLSTREMAERLGVSENTVKSHAGRLYDKLGARRRTQAVQSARAAGLLP